MTRNHRDIDAEVRASRVAQARRSRGESPPKYKIDDTVRTPGETGEQHGTVLAVLPPEPYYVVNEGNVFGHGGAYERVYAESQLQLWNDEPADTAPGDPDINAELHSLGYGGDLSRLPASIARVVVDALKGSDEPLEAPAGWEDVEKTF